MLPFHLAYWQCELKSIGRENAIDLQPGWPCSYCGRWQSILFFKAWKVREKKRQLQSLTQFLKLFESRWVLLYDDDDDDDDCRFVKRITQDASTASASYNLLFLATAYLPVYHNVTVAAAFMLIISFIFGETAKWTHLNRTCANVLVIV